MRSLRIAILCLLPFCSLALADTEPLPPDAANMPGLPALVPWTVALDRYVVASREMQNRLRETTMEVDIQAQIPKLKKEASLLALRQITRLGQITYQALRSAGDKMALKDVIARYITAEQQASTGQALANGKPLSLAITPDNYKFKYKGASTIGNQRTYIFQVTPRRKQVGLFKGEIRVDAETFMPVEESGRFVRNPSVFLKKVEFVRQYEIQDGLAVPTRIEAVVDTRLVGQAKLDIRFGHLVLPEMAQSSFCPLGW